MVMLNATEVRKNWSLTFDSVVHERPVYVKRTHDNIAMLSLNTLNEILLGYHFSAKQYQESNGSITLSADELDLVVNGADETEAKKELAAEIKDYAEDFYAEFPLWSSATNRKSHIPYVLKALLLDVNQIEREIICRAGKN